MTRTKGLFELGGVGLVTKVSEAVEGVSAIPDFTTSYKSNGAVNTTPIPTIPIVYDKRGVMHGLFEVDEEIRHAPLGLFRVGYNDRYHVTKSKVYTPDKKAKERLYLPLTKLEIAHEIEGISEERRVAEPMYGVFEAKDDEYPVMLVEARGSGLKGVRFYENRLGHLGVDRDVRLPFSRRDLEEYMRGLAPKTLISLTKSKGQKHKSSIDVGRPSEVRAHLDDLVIGHQGAKQTITVALMKYAARVREDDKAGALPHDNLFCLGSSGTGKSYTWRLIGDLLDEAKIPFIGANLTSLVPEGIKGTSVYNVLGNIPLKDGEKAPFAVVAYDELCKIVAGQGSDTETSMSPEIMSQLIGVTGKGKIPLNDSEGNFERYVDTRNMMFVLLGAFQGIGGGINVYDVAAKRLGLHNKIGLTKEAKVTPTGVVRAQDVILDDLEIAGVPSELLGRAGLLVPFNTLSQRQLIQILKHRSPEVSDMEAHRRLFKREHPEYGLTIRSEVYEEVAKRVSPRRGGRQLAPLCANLFEEILLDPSPFAKNGRVTLDGEFAERCFPRTTAVAEPAQWRGSGGSNNVGVEGRLIASEELEESGSEPIEIPLPTRTS